MKVKDIISYLQKHCNPEWDVVVMHPDSPDRTVAYAERSGKEQMALLVLDDGIERETNDTNNN